jgi:hypothetical protein
MDNGDIYAAAIEEDARVAQDAWTSAFVKAEQNCRLDLFSPYVNFRPFANELAVLKLQSYPYV